MTAVMMKADTRLASRGSNVGELGTILAATQTQEGVLSHFNHTTAEINRLFTQKCGFIVPYAACLSSTYKCGVNDCLYLRLTLTVHCVSRVQRTIAA